MTTKIETLADDIFLFASLGFLLVCYLVFFTLRRLHTTKVQYWTNLIDSLFLCSLTLLVIGGFAIVYTLM